MTNEKITGADLKSDLQPQGTRVRLIYKRSDMDGLSYMTEQDKDDVEDMLVTWVNRMGVEACYTWNLMFHDPVLAGVRRPEPAAETANGEQGAAPASWLVLHKLIQEAVPGFGDYCMPNTPCSALWFVINKHHKCLWGIQCMIAVQSRITGYDPQKYAMLDFPDHDTWSDAERLAIKFGTAVLGNEVPDALYEEAEQAWGVRGIMRILAWIGSTTSGCYLMNTFNLPSPAAHPWGISDPSTWRFVEEYNAGKEYEEIWGPIAYGPTYRDRRS